MSRNRYRVSASKTGGETIIEGCRSLSSEARFLGFPLRPPPAFYFRCSRRSAAACPPCPAFLLRSLSIFVRAYAADGSVHGSTPLLGLCPRTGSASQ